MIVSRGYAALPATSTPRGLRQLRSGHFFNVISNGYGAMPEYSSGSLHPQERWAIVAYIRALQLSQKASKPTISRPASTCRVA